MRVGVLFSGGKDSTYATYLASQRDQLTCLITVFPMSEESYMFHYPDLNWTKLQAEAIGIPQITQKTLGVKEEELKDLASALHRAKEAYQLEGVYSGALASVYQKNRVEGVCKDLGLQCISPLWGVEPEQHLRKVVRDGFVAMVVSVSALGLDREWLGRVIDHAAVDELLALSKKFRFNAALEGGEGETFVLDCPLFKSRVEIETGVAHWAGDSGAYEILGARLVPKPNWRTENAHP